MPFNQLGVEFLVHRSVLRIFEEVFWLLAFQYIGLSSGSYQVVSC